MTLVTSGDAGMDPVCSRPSGVERKSNSRPWSYQVAPLKPVGEGSDARDRSADDAVAGRSTPKRSSVYAPFVFQMSRCSRH